MNTPYFPQFRPRLAPARRAATQKIQQASLAQLEHYLEGIFPPHLLSQEDDGDNSRDRSSTRLPDSSDRHHMRVVGLSVPCFGQRPLGKTHAGLQNPAE